MNGKRWMVAAVVGALAGMGCLYDTGYSGGYSSSGSYRRTSYYPSSNAGRGSSYRRRSAAPLGNWTAESAGPRLGVVYVTGPAAEYMEYQGLSPFLTTFGWQFELQYESGAGGPVGLVEFIPMIAGFDKGMTKPVANLLFGIRTAQNLEVAAGPYFSENGAGLTVALGHSYRHGKMNMPIDYAVTTNPEGVRFSLTFGWNL
jgi:hypothetical protein